MTKKEDGGTHHTGTGTGFEDPLSSVRCRPYCFSEGPGGCTRLRGNSTKLSFNQGTPVSLPVERIPDPWGTSFICQDPRGPTRTLLCGRETRNEDLTLLVLNSG